MEDESPARLPRCDDLKVWSPGTGSLCPLESAPGPGGLNPNSQAGDRLWQMPQSRAGVGVGCGLAVPIGAPPGQEGRAQRQARPQPPERGPSGNAGVWPSHVFSVQTLLGTGLQDLPRPWAYSLLLACEGVRGFLSASAGPQPAQTPGRPPRATWPSQPLRPASAWRAGVHSLPTLHGPGPGVPAPPPSPACVCGNSGPWTLALKVLQGGSSLA